MLKAYEETHVYVPIDITKDVVQSDMQNLSVSAGPSGTDSRGWSFFQTVILQRVSGVYGLINICGQIDLRLDLWKKVAYNELVQDSHRATEEALWNKRGNQTQEQRNHTFSNIYKREIAQTCSFYLRAGDEGIF